MVTKTKHAMKSSTWQRGEISTPWGVLKIQTEDIVAKLENVKCFAKILMAALNDLDVEIHFFFQP